MSLSKWRNAALYAIAALVTAASLAAFTESYRGLYYWSAEHGLTGFWAYAWPIQLDAFIAVGELALFVALADRWLPRSRMMAWCVTTVGAVVSTAGNVGHMAGHSVWSMVSAGVPPVAAAAMLMVALGILKHVTMTPVAAKPVKVKPETVTVSPKVRETPSAAPVRKAPAARTRKAPRKATDADRAARLRALLDEGQAVTIDRAMVELKAGRPVAKRVLALAMNGNGRRTDG